MRSDDGRRVVSRYVLITRRLAGRQLLTAIRPETRVHAVRRHAEPGAWPAGHSRRPRGDAGAGVARRELAGRAGYRGRPAYGRARRGALAALTRGGGAGHDALRDAAGQADADQLRRARGGARRGAARVRLLVATLGRSRRVHARAFRQLAGISKSAVSKLCKEIDERVNGFLERPLEGELRQAFTRAGQEAARQA